MEKEIYQINFGSKKCCPILDTSVSGSPIIQDGKVIGAVTHVFIQDLAKWYGIFIENMLRTGGWEVRVKG